MDQTAEIKAPERHFLPKEFEVRDWTGLEPYFKNLLERKIDSAEDMEKWLKDMSELESGVSEDANWRQIRMTCDTKNKELEEAFTYFVLEIQPQIQSYSDKLNRKLIAS